MGHAEKQATAKFYKDSDIEQYQYLATLESHTCDECAHLDERIFYVKDKVEGKNYPLMHPCCRCTTVPYIKGLPDINTRWERGSNGKGNWIKNMSFAEWKKSQDIKPVKKLNQLTAISFIKNNLPAPKLTKNEKRAINQYISSESYKINYSLRNDIPLTKDQEKLVNNLDSALSKMPNYKSDKPLQRDYFFMNNDDLEEFIQQMKNSAFTDKGYLSTSKVHYGDGVEQIHVIINKHETGKDISDFNKNEQEVLFARNTTFKVTDAYKNNGILTLIWEKSHE